MNIENVKYTIINFDSIKNLVEVEFENEGKAIIQLRTPLPRNQEELENIIKQFASHKEIVETIDQTPEFIQELVGNQYTTKRFSLYEFTENFKKNMPTVDAIDPKIDLALEESDLRQLELEQIEVDKNKLRETLVELLDELGILNRK